MSGRIMNFDAEQNYLCNALSPSFSPLQALALLIKSPFCTAPRHGLYSIHHRQRDRDKALAFILSNRGFMLMFTLDVLLLNLSVLFFRGVRILKIFDLAFDFRVTIKFLI